MTHWKFKEFVSESGGEFENWVNALPLAHQAKIDVFISRLRLIKKAQVPTEWVELSYKTH